MPRMQAEEDHRQPGHIHNIGDLEATYLAERLFLDDFRRQRLIIDIPEEGL